MAIKGAVTLTNIPEGKQNVAVINESGLYSLTMTSRKPQAKSFKNGSLKKYFQ
ncbi:hypothetical protein COD76_11790 [Bacillus cereus]|nr:hypothetical protein COD76_11790 [Bacillus cereus]